jgi:hypothetical protein
MSFTLYEHKADDQKHDNDFQITNKLLIELLLAKKRVSSIFKDNQINYSYIDDTSFAL